MAFSFEDTFCASSFYSVGSYDFHADSVKCDNYTLTEGYLTLWSGDKLFALSYNLWLRSVVFIFFIHVKINVFF